MPITITCSKRRFYSVISRNKLTQSRNSPRSSPIVQDSNTAVWSTRPPCICPDMRHATSPKYTGEQRPVSALVSRRPRTLPRGPRNLARAPRSQIPTNHHHGISETHPAPSTPPIYIPISRGYIPIPPNHRDTPTVPEVLNWLWPVWGCTPTCHGCSRPSRTCAPKLCCCLSPI